MEYQGNGVVGAGFTPAQKSQTLHRRATRKGNRKGLPLHTKNNIG